MKPIIFMAASAFVLALPAMAAEDPTGASPLELVNCPKSLVYPAISQRMGEEGVDVIELEVHPNGTVVSTAVTSSTGHIRLDQAAKDGFAACSFKPTPAGGFYQVRYVWATDGSGGAAAIGQTYPRHVRQWDWCKSGSEQVKAACRQSGLNK